MQSILSQIKTSAFMPAEPVTTPSFFALWHTCLKHTWITGLWSLCLDSFGFTGCKLLINTVNCCVSFLASWSQSQLPQLGAPFPSTVCLEPQVDDDCLNEFLIPLLRLCYQHGNIKPLLLFMLSIINFMTKLIVSITCYWYFINCSSGPAQTAWAGGATDLVGLLWWEAASVYTAPAPPTPTAILPSRSPFSPTHPTPNILYPLIIHLHPRCSSPDTSLRGGIDALFPWSSQSCFGQADSPRALPLSTQSPGGGVGLGQGDPSLGGLGLVVF